MKKTNLINYFKTYFTFSKGDRNGIIILVVILFLLLVAIKLVRRTNLPESNQDFVALQKRVDSLYSNEDSSRFAKKKLLFNESKHDRAKPAPRIVVELNSADSLLLTQLPGIGPVMASRIIKYRNLLGGFYRVEQLMEVYGMKEEYFQKASQRMSINVQAIQKIGLDSVDYKTLYRHPYIGKDKARKIIQLKKTKGLEPILIQDLMQPQIFDSVEWERVKPYIAFPKKAMSK